MLVVAARSLRHGNRRRVLVVHALDEVARARVREQRSVRVRADEAGEVALLGSTGRRHHQLVVQTLLVRRNRRGTHLHAVLTLHVIVGARSRHRHASRVGAANARVRALRSRAETLQDELVVVAARAGRDGLGFRLDALAALHVVARAGVRGESAVGGGTLEAFVRALRSRTSGGEDDAAGETLGSVRDQHRIRHVTVRALCEVVRTRGVEDGARGVRALEACEVALRSRAIERQHQLAIQTVGSVRYRYRRRVLAVVTLHEVARAHVIVRHAVDIAAANRRRRTLHTATRGRKDLLAVQTARAVGDLARSRPGVVVALRVVLRAYVRVLFSLGVHADDRVVGALRSLTLAAGYDRALQTARSIGNGTRRRQRALVALHVVARARSRVDVSRGVRAAQTRVVALHSGAVRGENDFVVVAARAVGDGHGRGDGSIVALDEVVRARIGDDGSVRVAAAESLVVAGDARTHRRQNQLVSQTARSRGHFARSVDIAIVALCVVARTGVGVVDAVGVGAANALEVAAGSCARRSRHLLAVQTARSVGDGAWSRCRSVVALDVVAGARIRVHVAVGVGTLDSLVVALRRRAGGRVHDLSRVAARSLGNGHRLGDSRLAALQEVAGAGAGVDDAVGVRALDSVKVAFLVVARVRIHQSALVAARSVGDRRGRRQTAVCALHEVGLTRVLVDDSVCVRALDALEAAGGARAGRGVNDLALQTLGAVGDRLRLDVESVEAFDEVVRAGSRVDDARLVGADEVALLADRRRAVGVGDDGAVVALGSLGHGHRLGLVAVAALDEVVGARVGDDISREVGALEAVKVTLGGARRRHDLLVVVAARAVRHSARRRVGAELALDVVLGARVAGENALRSGAADPCEVAFVVGGGALGLGDEIAVVAAHARVRRLHRLIEGAVDALLIVLGARSHDGDARVGGAALCADVVDEVRALGVAEVLQRDLSVLAHGSSGHRLDLTVVSVHALLVEAGADVFLDDAGVVGADDSAVYAGGSGTHVVHHHFVVVALASLRDGHGLGDSSLVALHEVLGARVGHERSRGVAAAEAGEAAGRTVAGSGDDEVVHVAGGAVGNGGRFGDAAVVALHEVARAGGVDEVAGAVRALDSGEGAVGGGAVRVHHHLVVQTLGSGSDGHHVGEDAVLALAVVAGTRVGDLGSLRVRTVDAQGRARRLRATGRGSHDDAVATTRCFGVLHLDRRSLNSLLRAQGVVLCATVGDSRSILVNTYGPLEIAT